MDHNSFSPEMCHTCPMECYGRNISRPGAALYLLAAAASLAAFAVVFALNPDAARGFVCFPVFPFVFPVIGEKISKRLVRKLPQARIRRIYLGLAAVLSFFLTCLMGAVFESAVNVSALLYNSP